MKAQARYAEGQRMRLPSLSPGLPTLPVLYDPIRNSILNAIANCQHGMVQVGPAGVVKDSWMKKELGKGEGDKVRMKEKMGRTFLGCLWERQLTFWALSSIGPIE